MMAEETTQTRYAFYEVTESEYKMLADGLGLLRKSIEEDLKNANHLIDKRVAEKIRARLKSLENLQHNMKNTNERNIP